MFGRHIGRTPLADSVRWLSERGHLSRRQAVRLVTG
jgi:hypothetical protein